ncbi:unnamed protein product [Durusdinium trenchii]|uniref:Uncharacterized protein n=1 Tax=Durusdinium trenchii TaxID=1381693 RepID=A0ABP0QP78_9DINO
MTFWEQGADGRQVVIDAGAAIRLKRLERFGGRLVTTSGVYAEAVRKGEGRCFCVEVRGSLKRGRNSITWPVAPKQPRKSARAFCARFGAFIVLFVRLFFALKKCSSMSPRQCIAFKSMHTCPAP